MGEGIGWGCGVIVWLGACEELQAAQCEVVRGSVCTPLAIFSGEEEEEEAGPGEVTDGLLLGQAFLEGGFQGVQDVDGDGPDSHRRGVFLLVDSKSSAHI